jgi:hypothetical protein
LEEVAEPLPTVKLSGIEDPVTGRSWALTEGAPTFELTQVVLRLSVPFPVRGVTVTARLDCWPVATETVPVPCPIWVPAALEAFTVTFHCPKMSPEMVTLACAVLVEKVAPDGPVPEIA